MTKYIVRHLVDAYIPFDCVVEAKSPEEARKKAERFEEQEPIMFDDVRIEVWDENMDHCLEEIPE